MPLNSAQQLSAFSVLVRPKSGQDASSPPLMLSARADLPFEATHPARYCLAGLVRPGASAFDACLCHHKLCVITALTSADLQRNDGL